MEHEERCDENCPYHLSLHHSKVTADYAMNSKKFTMAFEEKFIDNKAKKMI